MKTTTAKIAAFLFFGWLYLIKDSVAVEVNEQDQFSVIPGTWIVECSSVGTTNSFVNNLVYAWLRWSKPDISDGKCKLLDVLPEEVENSDDIERLFESYSVSPHGIISEAIVFVKHNKFLIIFGRYFGQY
mgnify:CR=1 FL=1